MSSSQEVRGNTLKVYLYLLKHGTSELRDIQHALGFSSASLASYHLGKLSEAGYVKQDEYGRYYAIKETSEKVLEGFAKIGPKIVPQLFFFSIFFTVLVSFFATATLITPTYVPYLIIICVAMVAILWYETFRLWRKLSI